MDIQIRASEYVTNKQWINVVHTYSEDVLPTICKIIVKLCERFKVQNVTDLASNSRDVVRSLEKDKHKKLKIQTLVALMVLFKRSVPEVWSAVLSC